MALATVAHPQEPWANKDWKQWSKDDCKRILEDSPFRDASTTDDNGGRIIQLVFRINF